MQQSAGLSAYSVTMICWISYHLKIWPHYYNRLKKIDNVYFALCILLDENWDEENLRKTLEMILQFPHQAPNLAGLYLSRPPHLAETLEVLRQNPIQIPNIEFIFADLDQHKLLDLVNTDKILQHPLQAGNIAWILKVLAHHQLLTPANIITMLQQLEQSGHMVKIVEALEHAQSLTPEEIMAILQQDGHETIEMLPDPTQIAHVAQIFQLLQLQGVQLSTRDEENIIKLLDPEQAKNIYEVCKILERAQALNAKNISALLQSPEQTNIMKWAFEILEHAQLLNADHLNALLQSPEKIVEITWILKILQPLQLLNAENIAIVLLPTSKKIDASAWHEMIGIMKFLDRHHYANSKNIIAALHATQPQSRFLLLSTLRKSKDLGAATPKSVANIIQHPVYAKQIENIFNFLRESQLDTPQRKITLLKHPEHSTNIIELINILQRVRLFNPKNLDDILKHIQQSAALQEALQSLEKAEKLSQKTFNNVLSRPKEALFIAKKLGASLDPEMPATRDFMNIRKTAHLLLLAKCASQRQSTATPKYFGKLPPEILFDISDRTGTGALDEDSAIIAARGHYPTPT